MFFKIVLPKYFDLDPANENHRSLFMTQTQLYFLIFLHIVRTFALQAQCSPPYIAASCTLLISCRIFKNIFLSIVAVLFLEIHSIGLSFAHNSIFSQFLRAISFDNLRFLLTEQPCHFRYSLFCYFLHSFGASEPVLLVQAFHSAQLNAPVSDGVCDWRIPRSYAQALKYVTDFVIRFAHKTSCMRRRLLRPGWLLPTLAQMGSYFKLGSPTKLHVADSEIPRT